MHLRLCVDDRLVVTGLCMVVGLGFGGWASVEAVHEPAGVVPVHPGGGGLFDVADRPQGAGAERRVVADALGLYRPMVVSARALS
jgi:hypothetical protein